MIDEMGFKPFIKTTNPLTVISCWTISMNLMPLCGKAGNQETSSSE